MCQIQGQFSPNSERAAAVRLGKCCWRSHSTRQQDLVRRFCLGCDHVRTAIALGNLHNPSGAPRPPAPPFLAPVLVGCGFFWAVALALSVSHLISCDGQSARALLEPAQTKTRDIAQRGSNVFHSGSTCTCEVKRKLQAADALRPAGRCVQEKEAEPWAEAPCRHRRPHHAWSTLSWL
jgi:hypothetical protein